MHIGARGDLETDNIQQKRLRKEAIPDHIVSERVVDPRKNKINRQPMRQIGNHINSHSKGALGPPSILLLQLTGSHQKARARHQPRTLTTTLT